mmetsp:Transcript_12580/g.29885  ORF Transcript_12580/g.29885 Transcript_12580/m.29885 type:complete len:216 (+) Transcript_12580:1-648(+)
MGAGFWGRQDIFVTVIVERRPVPPLRKGGLNAMAPRGVAPRPAPPSRGCQTRSLGRTSLFTPTTRSMIIKAPRCRPSRNEGETNGAKRLGKEKALWRRRKSTQTHRFPQAADENGVRKGSVPPSLHALQPQRILPINNRWGPSLAAESPFRRVLSSAPTRWLYRMLRWNQLGIGSGQEVGCGRQRQLSAEEGISIRRPTFRLLTRLHPSPLHRFL